jgi:uncharacterized protein (DUF1778 family)
MAVDTEIKFRISPDDKDLLQRAAAIDHTTLSELLRSVATAHARAIVEASQIRQVTVLSPEEYDAMIDALDVDAAVDRSRFDRARTRLENLDLD